MKYINGIDEFIFSLSRGRNVKKISSGYFSEQALAW